MKTIYEFEQNDIITRVTSNKQDSNMYIGERLIFLGIVNGLIYLKQTAIEQIKYHGLIIQLPVSSYEEGWDYYMIVAIILGTAIVTENMPEKFTFDIETYSKTEYKMSIAKRKEILTNKLEIALANQNYDIAENLQKEIDYIITIYSKGT